MTEELEEDLNGGALKVGWRGAHGEAGNRDAAPGVWATLSAARAPTGCQSGGGRDVMGAFHESAVVQGGRSEEAQSKRSYRSLKNTSNYPSCGRGRAGLGACDAAG